MPVLHTAKLLCPKVPHDAPPFSHMFVKRSVPLTGTSTKPREEKQAHNVGIRPSIVNSKPCVSSGSRTLDLLLGHGGVPVGTSLALLEHGTTDFASSIIKAFCAYGINESRSGSKTVVVVLGVPDFAKSLPSINEKQGTNSNTTSEPRGNQSSRKIAWRYRPSQEQAPKPTAYAPDLNYRSTSLKRPQPNEVIYITGTLVDMASQLKETLEQAVDSQTLHRVVVPNLLHPAVYKPSASNPKEFVPFLYCLRQLIAKHNAAMMISLSMQLYPSTHPVIVHVQQLMDAVVELEPFENDKVQGFVHVLKLAELSQRGVMVTRRHEYAFKLAKTQLEISEWAIPVDVDDEQQGNSANSW